MPMGMHELIIREDIARYCRAMLSTFVATPHGKLCCVSTGMPSTNGRLRLIPCNGSGGIPYNKRYLASCFTLDKSWGPAVAFSASLWKKI